MPIRFLKERCAECQETLARDIETGEVACLRCGLVARVESAGVKDPYGSTIGDGQSKYS